MNFSGLSPLRGLIAIEKVRAAHAEKPCQITEACRTWAVIAHLIVIDRAFSGAYGPGDIEAGKVLALPDSLELRTVKTGYAWHCTFLPERESRAAASDIWSPVGPASVPVNPRSASQPAIGLSPPFAPSPVPGSGG